MPAQAARALRIGVSARYRRAFLESAGRGKAANRAAAAGKSPFI
ncbi:hypothetical protein COLSTE_02251 [Collinsella stercoris DSM 13279]|uniref:Uncharacterized protein n=1 Tax=Collinsella stercoris DSM 13279 TaxID=445975 RepID=B6GDR8_9ACTN|nr:hypothetical protein COLSTE_02251 [Collinsella stercoris DSM 13279]